MISSLLQISIFLLLAKYFIYYLNFNLLDRLVFIHIGTYISFYLYLQRNLALQNTNFWFREMFYAA